ncbi:hypothetical protein [Algibacillus agarilyticus]|uniref:hypothetical protein n=1 Tax=Algibacillus agarilyticus TaxID=2234133 RepID=UPI000DCFE19A|nr:hypothetical protein [Algibacillus agarilyticus]
MGLADLKSTYEPSAKRKVISIDEFINGAEYYAKGLPETLANQPTSKPEVTNKKSKYKACTFTLTPTVRDELSQCAQALGVNKSKLVRIMTHNLNAMGSLERQLIVKLYNIDD